MIRIVRSPAPEVLRTEGAARRAADQASVRLGNLDITFDRTVYAHDDVKRALVEMQHEKCAFCEAKPLPTSFGDVEHFRPKAAVRQDEASELERPGYYWLAYEWTNLLFSCEQCNRRHKRNAFPLADPARRVRSPADDLAAEDPMFLDPSAEDPTQHITFREHVPRGLTERGKATVRALGLNRAELNRDREEHLRVRQRLAELAALPMIPPGDRERAREQLRRATEPDAEYSLMCRIAFPK